MSRKYFGLGLGYDGFRQAGVLTNGAFLGAGFTMEPVSLGLDIRQLNLAGVISPNIDMGLRIGENNGPVFGLVLYDLNDLPQLDVGLGWAAKKKYNVELNVLLPPFAYLTGDFTVTAAATVNASIFALYFRASFEYIAAATSQTIGLAANLSDNIVVLIQYSSGRVWTAGFTYLW